MRGEGRPVCEQAHVSPEDRGRNVLVAATAELPVRTRIVLAEDHALVRAAFRALLGKAAGVEVVGEAGDGLEAVALVGSLRPDVVLMDVGMPRVGGLEATERIVAARTGARVLIVSRRSDAATVEAALRAGADGYVAKTASAEDLLRGIDAVRAGNAFLSPGIARSLGGFSGGSAEPSLGALSPREREILARLADGLSSREIGSALHVSPRTVDTHRVRIMKKLGIHRTPQLVRFAIRAGLVEA